MAVLASVAAVAVCADVAGPVGLVLLMLPLLRPLLVAVPLFSCVLVRQVLLLLWDQSLIEEVLKSISITVRV